MDKETHKQGTSFSKTYTVEEDTTGWLISSQIRKSDGSLFAELEVTSTVEDDVATVVIAMEDTSDWKPGTYFYDVRYEKPDGTVTAEPTVQLTIEKSITR